MEANDGSASSSRSGRKSKTGGQQRRHRRRGRPHGPPAPARSAGARRRRRTPARARRLGRAGSAARRHRRHVASRSASVTSRCPRRPRSARHRRCRQRSRRRVVRGPQARADAPEGQRESTPFNVASQGRVAIGRECCSMRRRYDRWTVRQKACCTATTNSVWSSTTPCRSSIVSTMHRRSWTRSSLPPEQATATPPRRREPLDPPAMRRGRLPIGDANSLPGAARPLGDGTAALVSPDIRP